MPSDKSSTPKINQQTSFETKTHNWSTRELTSKKAKTDIINNDSQKLRSERTAELDTVKSLPKSITIGSIKNSSIFIQSIFRGPIPLIKDIETIHGAQSTLKSGVGNALTTDHIKSQIRKPELNISETKKYRLTNKNPKPATLNKTFENTFKAEVEIEAEVLMEEYDLEDLLSKKTQTKDGKNLLPREWTRLFSKKVSVVNPFCCIAFDRHLLPKKAEHLFAAPFYCTIAGCNLTGEIFLYPNMTLVIKDKSNAIVYAKKTSNSFKSRKITGSQRDNLKRTLVVCPFPSREDHKKLSQVDECKFNSVNLGENGNSKNVYNKSSTKV